MHLIVCKGLSYYNATGQCRLKQKMDNSSMVNVKLVQSVRLECDKQDKYIEDLDTERVKILMILPIPVTVIMTVVVIILVVTLIITNRAKD